MSAEPSTFFKVDPDASALVPACTETFPPEWLYSMGAANTPFMSPINPARPAASPPSSPPSTRARALRCSSVALASRMSAAVKLPPVQGPEKVAARMALVPETSTPSTVPSEKSKAKIPAHVPPVGVCPKAQGQGVLQLQNSVL